MLYCKKCKKYRAFYLKDGVWICVGCMEKINENKENWDK